MNKNKSKDENAPEISLEEATRLVDAIERDLDQVHGDSHDLKPLKDEIETLKNVLNSPIRRHHWIREGLHSMRMVFEESMDTAMALAAKNARIAWALLAHERKYQRDYVATRPVA